MGAKACILPADRMRITGGFPKGKRGWPEREVCLVFGLCGSGETCAGYRLFLFAAEGDSLCLAAGLERPRGFPAAVFLPFANQKRILQNTGLYWRHASKGSAVREFDFFNFFLLNKWDRNNLTWAFLLVKLLAVCGLYPIYSVLFG